jgi:hypothetical protein
MGKRKGNPMYALRMGRKGSTPLETHGSRALDAAILSGELGEGEAVVETMRYLALVAAYAEADGETGEAWTLETFLACARDAWANARALKEERGH